MSDMSNPAAPVASTESAAAPVTQQETTTEQVTPQVEGDKPDDQAGEPQAEAKEAKPAESDQEEGDKPQTWKEKRAERNRRRWQEYKEARELLPKRLEQLEREVQRLSKTEEPDFTRFEDPNEELAERTAWKVRQQHAREAETRLQEERQRVASEHQEKLMSAWAETVEAARETMPDFDQVFTRDTPVHERAIRPIVESDVSAEVAYHLGKNPREAQALYEAFDRDPVRGLIEFGRLEARLSKPASKPVTAAPKPAQPISGGINPAGFNAEKASVDDMARYLREKGIIR